MQFSERFKKEARKYNMPPQAVLMADLMVLGYTDSEAYNVAYADRTIYSVDANIRHRESIVEDQKFQNMMQMRAERVNADAPRKTSDIELMSREDAVKEILQAAKNMPAKSKERGEMFIKYNEALTKLQKNDDTGDAVNIYLPLKCFKCQLYQDFIERQGEKIEERITNSVS